MRTNLYIMGEKVLENYSLLRRRMNVFKCEHKLEEDLCGYITRFKKVDSVPDLENLSKDSTPVTIIVT